MSKVIRFVDENGHRLSLADLEVMAEEERRARGFPYYTPSEDSAQAQSSLRSLFAEAKKTKLALRPQDV